VKTIQTSIVDPWRQQNYHIYCIYICGYHSSY